MIEERALKALCERTEVEITTSKVRGVVVAIKAGGWSINEVPDLRYAVVRVDYGDGVVTEITVPLLYGQLNFL